MCVSQSGKSALTHVSVEQRFRGLTLLCCKPRTGRTHQVRVHLSASGFPLAIDPVYGHRRELLLSEFKAGYRRKPGRPEHPLMDRLTLHAASLSFPHLDGRRLEVAAPVPRDFARVLKQLSKVRAYP
jgi:23S rRNA pseudouridine955/2504/2580 synthase